MTRRSAAMRSIGGEALVRLLHEEYGNARVGSATDPATRVRLTASVVPAAGWVRLNASVTGVAAGRKCRLAVVSRDGSREIAGSWTVSAKDEADGTNVDGSAAVAAQDVVAVEVLTAAGEQLVSLKI